MSARAPAVLLRQLGRRQRAPKTSSLRIRKQQVEITRHVYRSYATGTPPTDAQGIDGSQPRNSRREEKEQAVNNSTEKCAQTNCRI